MKKIVSLLALALCFCLLLAGCGGKAGDGDNTATTTTTRGLISEEEAIAIAEQHFGIENGSRDDKTGYLMSYRIVTPVTSGITTYRIALLWLVEVDGQASHWSTLDTVTIDAKTGAVLIETIDP